jgi:mono/diheme cytochrome c family protein
MKRALVAAVAIWLMSLGLSARAQPARPATRSAAAPPRRINAPPTTDATTQTMKQYCVGCHSDRGKAGDLSLADFDVARATDHPETAEKIIRKLRAGMMPPAGSRRPDEATLQALRQTLETRMDRWAAANPNPGWRPSSA